VKTTRQEKNIVKKRCQISFCQNFKLCIEGKKRIYVYDQEKIENRRNVDYMSLNAFQKDTEQRMRKFHAVKISTY